MSGSNDGGVTSATAGAGTADVCRIEFTPTSEDGRFGVFQIYLEGVPLGDGTTTALYPHYRDLQALCLLVEQHGVRERERQVLGDTFDHLDLYWQLTDTDVIFTCTTQPRWGAPPPWAPAVGEWIRLRVTRSNFMDTWREVEPQVRHLLDRPR